MSNPDCKEQQLLDEIVEKAFDTQKNESVISESKLNSILESICEVTGISREEAQEIANDVIEKHKDGTEFSKPLDRSTSPLELSTPLEFSKPSLFSLFFSWVFGCFFFFLSIIFTDDMFLIAMGFLIIACFLLPPVRTLAYIKTGYKVPFIARGVIIFIISFAISSIVLGEYREYKAQGLVTEKAREHTEKIELIQYRTENNRQQ
ncbi:hypothetical protein MHO82_12980 [Vibrio sp. Of7-15]|uniref:hypothetical protein n=1 Tax=Vibrio sp. Of7-15 TaxID=2724879 RepID=UPI001EF29847|nr:hypothetical protein [Vibrio sp. Of7-15]MCG7497778.1 hypothetical protein [Vibrio sp. Of7-15]